VAGAGLDVFSNEPQVHPDLLTIPNVSLTPHIGTATIETRWYYFKCSSVLTSSQMTELALKNIEAVLSGNTPVTPVNYIQRNHNTEGYASPTKKSKST
jgi:glyoxylate reductase